MGRIAIIDDAPDILELLEVILLGKGGRLHRNERLLIGHDEYAAAHSLCPRISCSMCGLLIARLGGEVQGIVTHRL